MEEFWTAFDTIWLALIITWILTFAVFMFAFERLGKHERDLGYYAGSTENRRVDLNKLYVKMSSLYEEDEHNFSRPKVDMLGDETRNLFTEMHKRIWDLEQKKGEK